MELAVCPPSSPHHSLPEPFTHNLWETRKGMERTAKEGKLPSGKEG